MKRIAVFAAAAMGVAFTQSALGADLGVRPAPVYAPPPVAVAPTWTGVYLGFNGGWGWTNNNNSNNSLTFAPSATNPGGFVPFTVTGGSNSGNNNGNGPVFGGQLGYNYQAGSWVFGVEGDVDGANIRKSQAGAIAPGLVGLSPAIFPSAGSAFLNTRQEWLASIRGRLGYTWGPGMIYVTGGGAWTGLQTNGGATLITGETATFSNSTTLSGWVVGAGYEYMIAPNWALRGEYLYYGFTGNNNNNTGTLVFPIAGATVTGNTGKLNTSVVRIGLDYKFDWLR
jgi:outer membrane immunogenic protein